MRVWPRINGRMLLGTLVIVTSVLVTNLASAQSVPDGGWSAISRLTATGTNEGSDPDGYKVYSAIALEVGARRYIGRFVALEMTGALQSREVEFPDATGIRENLGSIEMLPVTVTVQLRPFQSGRWRPYIGAGGNLTLCWEKSGRLDNHDLTPSIGAVVQAGVDYEMTDRASLNLDIRWNQARTDLERDGVRVATLRLQPATLGVGFLFRF